MILFISSVVIIFCLSYFLLHWKLLIALSVAIMTAATLVALQMALRPALRNTKVYSGLVFALLVASGVLILALYQPLSAPPPPPTPDYEPIVVDCVKAQTNPGTTVVTKYYASVNIPGELQWFESNHKDFSVQNFHPASPTPGPGPQRPCSETSLDGTGGSTNKCSVTGKGYFKYDIDCKNGTVIDPMIQIPRPMFIERLPD